MGFKVIGSSPPKVDGIEKVMGNTVYVADMKFPNLCHIKILRSIYAHAQINGIDTSKATNSPGVFKVITGEDVPGPFGVAIRDQNPIAKGKVRYVGEPVAVVVARTEKEAARALSKIKVDYEPLEFVISPWEAKNEDSPVIHEKLMEYEIAPYLCREGHNTYQHFRVRKGEAETALATADCMVEGEFFFSPAVHTQLEPHCAIARYDVDGSITIYATTQAPFIVQSTMSELLNIPYNKIKVIAPSLGGGFGGKSDITIEALVCCVAKLVPGKYVRLLLTREEMFSGTTHGRNASCRYKIGFNNAGKLLAVCAESVLGSGGNADYAVNVVTGMALSGTGPYKVDNVSLDVFGVYTNTPPIGALRGYGHPEVHFAIESLMHMAADKLGMEQNLLRRINLLQAGDSNGIGQIMHSSSGNVAECELIMSDKLYALPKRSAGADLVIGRGMAAYMKTPCMVSNAQSGAFIKLNADGSVTLSTGAVDMGQGLHTALSQIAAEALDLPLKKINFLSSVNTLISPYDWQTVASRTTWGVGNAIIIAAADLKKKLCEQAAILFGIDAEEVQISGGEVRACGKSIPWDAFAIGIRGGDGSAITRPVMGEGYFVPIGVQNPDINTGQSNAAPDWTFGCCGAEVAIDKRTGEIDVIKLFNVIDAGTIINPQIATEQVNGAMLMALGSALCETVIFDKKTGRIRNDSLVDYKIPGIEDIAEDVQIFFVQTHERTGPFGAKGLGEHGAVGIAPAILNAIYDATGVRFYSLPVSADVMSAALSGGVDYDS